LMCHVKVSRRTEQNSRRREKAAQEIGGQHGKINRQRKTWQQHSEGA